MSDDYLTEDQKKNIIKSLPPDCIIKWTSSLNYIIDSKTFDCSGIKSSYFSN
ncbi:hypothetical protein O2K51_04455 [Apibacter raozihei]|uniref:hypothetical protein n=1 Tax=Apibacter raozihei TaxID=2500547 RepID=UPI0013E3DCB1|nr:hypothetical protein [Apibacter raozihei]